MHINDKCKKNIQLPSMLYSIEKFSFSYFNKVFTYLLAQEKVSIILPSHRFRVGLGMYPGIYPFNPLFCFFFLPKKPVFFVESGLFDETLYYFI